MSTTTQDQDQARKLADLDAEVGEPSGPPASPTAGPTLAEIVARYHASDEGFDNAHRKAKDSEVELYHAEKALQAALRATKGAIVVGGNLYLNDSGEGISIIPLAEVPGAGLVEATGEGISSDRSEEDIKADIRAMMGSYSAARKKARRTFDITINDYQFERASRVGLTLEEVIRERGDSIDPGDDLAVWEGGRLLAVIRARHKDPRGPEVIVFEDRP